MKKTVVILIVLLLLFGCGSTNENTKIISEYQHSYDKISELISFKLDFNSKISITDKDGNLTTSTTVIKDERSNINSDNILALTEISIDENSTSSNSKLYFTDGKLYIDEDGVKTVKTSTYSDFNNLLSSYYSLEPLKEDSIDSILETNEDAFTVYTISVNKDKYKISLSENSSVYSDIDKINVLKYEETVKVNSVGNIVYINTILQFDYNATNDKQSFLIESTLKLSEFDNVEIESPTDISEYGDLIYNKNDYIYWLTNNYFYEKVDSVYIYKYKDNMIFTYDFGESTFSLNYDGTIYEINYLNHIGEVDSCIYDFNEGTTKNCSDDETNLLIYTANCLFQELDRAGTDIQTIKE